MIVIPPVVSETRPRDIFNLITLPLLLLSAIIGLAVVMLSDSSGPKVNIEPSDVPHVLVNKDSSLPRHDEHCSGTTLSYSDYDMSTGQGGAKFETNSPSCTGK